MTTVALAAAVVAADRTTSFVYTLRMTRCFTTGHLQPPTGPSYKLHCLHILYCCRGYTHIQDDYRRGLYPTCFTLVYFVACVYSPPPLRVCVCLIDRCWCCVRRQRSSRLDQHHSIADATRHRMVLDFNAKPNNAVKKRPDTNQLHFVRRFIPSSQHHTLPKINWRKLCLLRIKTLYLKKGFELLNPICNTIRESKFVMTRDNRLATDRIRVHTYTLVDVDHSATDFRPRQKPFSLRRVAAAAAKTRPGHLIFFLTWVYCPLFFSLFYRLSDGGVVVHSSLKSSFLFCSNKTLRPNF